MNENENPRPEENSAETRKKHPLRKRGLLIGAAAAVALIAVGGSAYAIGSNIGEDDDDRPAVVGNTTTDDGHVDRNDSEDDGRSGGSQDDARGAGLPASDAAALRAAAEKAVAAAGAAGATSIDVERTGYEIEVQLADGSERDLLVAVDGTITTDTDRPDDDRPDPVLDLARLADIEKAALAAAASAGGADGVIDSISGSDSPGVAYEVSIRLADGRDADVELAADFSAVTTDLDD